MKGNSEFNYMSLPEDETSSDDDLTHKTETCLPCSSIRCRSRHVTVSTVLLPLGAFIFSVFWAFYHDYRAATLVFCQENQVYNYLPSLSAAIGDFQLSKSVWIFCVTLHAPSRFFYAYKYYKYLTRIIYKRYHKLVLVACILNVLENVGLLGLSYISSKKSLPLHCLNFLLFIVASESYMILTCYLLLRCRNIPCVKTLEIKSQRWKLRLLIVILVCSASLPYFYTRHNFYCEPGIYTIFAFLEYIVVLCNMGFHLTAYWDFYDHILRIPIRRFCRDFEC